MQATAQDARGALSLPAKSDPFSVHERPLLTLGGIGITQTWFFVGLVLILLAGFAAGWWTVRLQGAQRGRKIVLAQRDIVVVFDKAEKDLDKTIDLLAAPAIDEAKKNEIHFTLDQLKTSLARMRKYILENIKEIND